MTELPAGWASAKIGDVAASTFDGPFGSALKTSDYTTEGFRVARLENIGHLRFRGELSSFVSEEKFLSLSRHVLKADDVLFSSFVDKQTRVCLVPVELDGRMINKADCFCVRSRRDAYEPGLLAYRLAAPASYAAFSGSVRGVTRPRIGLKDLTDYEIEVPPLAEQRRIMAKLDTLTACTARARADLDRIPALVTRYKQAVLGQALAGELFTDGLGGSKALTLGDLGKWASGGTPKSGRSEYYGGNVPWVRSGDLRDGPIASHAVTITDAGLANSSAKWVPKGAVLLAMYGATIGRVGLTTYPVTTNQAVASLQCDQSLISPSFAFWLLRSLKPAFVGAGQGGAQPNISQTIIKSWPALVPPLDKQERIVRGLERAFSDIDRLTAEHTAARRLLGRLDQAVLDKAFRGELVPQDPADEPASVLLDRIRAERAAAPKPRRKLSPRTLATRKKTDMPKSRLDDDVKHQPFLASILKASGTALSVDSLFGSADLPIADFYKQLAWEIDNGLVAERGETLEAA